MRFVIVTILCFAVFSLGSAFLSLSNELDPPSNEPDPNSPPMFLPKPVPMLIAFRSLEKLNPDATREEISAFAQKRFGVHPFAEEWTELSLRLRRESQGKIGELRRFAQLEIQILTDVSAEKHIEHIEAYQEALKQLDRLEKRFKSEEKPGDEIVLALPLRATEAPEPLFYRWKGEALKRLARFESLKVNDPDAARVELSEIVKIRFGAHAFADEWIALYFRLSRDGKGRISDLKRLVELEIRILTDVGHEKHAEQIERHRQAFKSYDALIMTLKNENKDPETALMDF